MTSNARLRPQASGNMLMIPQFPKRHTEMKRAPSRKISNNWLQLNSKKCKEMRVSFLRQEPSYSPLTVNNCALEVVSSHKVLGVTIQNDLKWGTHIENIIKKASKCLHILRILKRASVPLQDLLVIYLLVIHAWVTAFISPSSNIFYLRHRLHDIFRQKQNRVALWERNRVWDACTGAL